jgi:RNA-directed DNA polymerase
LDKELERRGHRFARYADDCNVYVQSEAAGKRVMASLERFLSKRLQLKINREKSAVARPWGRKFLGYSVTLHHKTKLKVAPASVKRLKANLCELLRRGRGRNLSTVIRELRPVIRGWIAYFQWSDVKGVFEELDKWLRRKLRCILWRQWKRPRTRFRELCRHGVNTTRAAAFAFKGRGPWWNAGASHMHLAVPTKALTNLGLMSFTQEHQRLARSF